MNDSSIQELGSELVGLCLKDVLKGEIFTISSSYLNLGGAVPPGSAWPLMSPDWQPVCQYRRQKR